MTRKYSDFNTELSQAQLSQLADKTTTPGAYKNATTLLGDRLGEIISSKITDRTATLYLACTIEDADYLAKGMLAPLERHLKSVSLACFWNERFSPFDVNGIKVSPTTRKYNAACVEYIYD